MNHRRSFLLLALMSSLACLPQDGPTAVGGTRAMIGVAARVAPSDRAPTPQLLETYCLACHGESKQKGKVRFDAILSLPPAERAELLTRASEAIRLGEMPPDGKPRPTEAEAQRLLEWMEVQSGAKVGAQLADKLRYPQYGNLVDHAQLFRGDGSDEAWTPSRRWLVSPQIFVERVIDVFKLEGKERKNFLIRGFHGVTNPFLLPDHSGVRYYDLGVLDGGHLLVMLNNAKWIVGKQIYAAQLKRPDKDQLPELTPQDRWYPRKTSPAFEAIVVKDSAPTEAEMIAAIGEQFDCVLRRQPTNDEKSRYLDLLRTSIELGGNVEGLRQMLVAVLLESEFLYRYEFGGGEADDYGRKLLTPGEGASAISYALGDRRPDQRLRDAAVNGQLETRADYEREVRRLLADSEFYRGQIDSTLNGKHYQSSEVSHPKIIRFFREFFGYPGALKVFKDGKRAEAKYSNPDRGSQGTPGWLIYEADKFVAWQVAEDQKVIENLLTSDEFFVYHNMDNAKGLALLVEWRGVYEKLKETAWKTEPEKVLEENLEFLKTQKSLKIVDTSRPGELVNYMHFFAESFGKGRNPFTRIPWSHGYTYHHSPFYSLPPTPSIGRYGSWKSTEYLGDKLEAREFWDYPTQQPFKIANRKGILTHPAWLIAHSTNFHSDPIRRGRFIREKLLAGRVPDIPITVDAQVPEDPHKTFRERVVEVTASDDCWKCHQHMNPLGLAFEMYDDFGRFRTEEVLEHPDNLIKKGNDKTTFDQYPTLPVVSRGTLSGTEDPDLDGDVDNALDMIDRLEKSDRVRQSVIRHAFRFFMGRNERISDSRTLIDAEQAYLRSGGSFNEVIVALLTSDSFLYRKDDEARR